MPAQGGVLYAWYGFYTMVISPKDKNIFKLRNGLFTVYQVPAT